MNERLKAHIAIARLDHSIKNVFVIPGIVVPLTVSNEAIDPNLGWKLLLGFVAITLIACSNYVLNEILDAPFDRSHPTKKNRPVVAGLVSTPIAYLQWLLMMVAGMFCGSFLGWQVSACLAALWIMGCVYNTPPIRTKDQPYLDVLSESVNNPLRMLHGWYLVTTTVTPPVSLLISYWMVGAYFMALKRFSEYRQLNDRIVAASYRKSFGHYTERSLLSSVVFYASAAMLFFGAFIMRYRLELVLSFPLVSVVMAVYFHMAFEPDSAVQNPEKLYREPKLVMAVLACLILMFITFVIDIPLLHRLFQPTMPTP